MGELLGFFLTWKNKFVGRGTVHLDVWLMFVSMILASSILTRQ